MAFIVLIVSIFCCIMAIKSTVSYMYNVGYCKKQD